MLKADLVQEEVDAPSGNRCASGHTAPPEFRRGGPDSPPEPTRFFRVTGQGVSGTYCEPCLMVANYVNAQRKKAKKEREQNGTG